MAVRKRTANLSSPQITVHLPLDRRSCHFNELSNAPRHQHAAFGLFDFMLLLAW